LNREGTIEALSILGRDTSIKRSDIVYKHMHDPVLLRYYYKLKMMPATSKLEIVGSSPTDLFVGRYGYPYVNIGPLLPPEFGDTSLLGTPERWVHMSISDIVEMRSKLVRGMHLTKVGNVEKGRMEEFVRDLALAERPAEADATFSKKPSVRLALRDEVQPFGPSGQLKGLEVYNVKADVKVENMYCDTDATAKTAMVDLYNKGIPVSKIQRGLSAGLFGLKNNRKFVPTRWSITAVDDTLSKVNLEEVKGYDPIDAIYAYYNCSLDNRWLIFLIPGNWQYESIEAWWPKTIWNKDGTEISIYSSDEGYYGRKDYAEIGGCYYSGRLAITEKLQMLKRQAIALILREVHEGYLMPVGVWNVREHVRETLQCEPAIMHSMAEMMECIKGRLDIGTAGWIRNSRVLKDLLSQKRLMEYVKAEPNALVSA
jgi:hypothetical protein